MGIVLNNNRETHCGCHNPRAGKSPISVGGGGGSIVALHGPARFHGQHSWDSGFTPRQRRWLDKTGHPTNCPPGRRTTQGYARLRHSWPCHTLHGTLPTVTSYRPAVAPGFRLGLHCSHYAGGSHLRITHLRHAVTHDVWTLTANAAGDCGIHQHLDHVPRDNECQ